MMDSFVKYLEKKDPKAAEKVILTLAQVTPETIGRMIQSARAGTGQRYASLENKKWHDFEPDQTPFQWHHLTYAAWCRHNGTHETQKQPYRCWNEDH
jgi:hypothetical protein